MINPAFMFVPDRAVKRRLIGVMARHPEYRENVASIESARQASASARSREARIYTRYCNFMTPYSDPRLNRPMPSK